MALGVGMSFGYELSSAGMGLKTRVPSWVMQQMQDGDEPQA